jgi:hypothetical protein
MVAEALLGAVASWQARHRSYFGRITGGTHLRLVQAARGGVQLTAPSEQP